MDQIKYHDLETLPESKAKEMAIESMVIKGYYNVFFVNLGGAFGYSCLVYKNGHPIHYLNNFALHYPQIKSEKELKEKFINILNNKVFTEEELLQPLKTYDEYNNKLYFLNNYYHMDHDNVSQFFIVTPESVKEHEKAIEGLYYNPVGFCYMADEKFIDHHKELYMNLEKLFADTVNDYEYQKSAFEYEMWNHEYAINWQGDYDVLSVFGNVNFHDDVDTMMNKLGFNDVQKHAYRDARAKVCKESDY